MLIALSIILMIIMLTVSSPTLRAPIIRMVRPKVTPAAIAASVRKTLSDPAQSLYDEYMKLPEDSRPFPDIESVLAGLDASTSHDVDGRTSHFDRNGYMRRTYGEHHEYRFSWLGDDHRPCTNSHRTCDFRAYYVLHEEIKQLHKQIVKKERALNLSHNTENVDRARELVEALRQERAIQRQVTEELT